MLLREAFGGLLDAFFQRAGKRIDSRRRRSGAVDEQSQIADRAAYPARGGQPLRRAVEAPRVQRVLEVSRGADRFAQRIAGQREQLLGVDEGDRRFNARAGSRQAAPQAGNRVGFGGGVVLAFGLDRDRPAAHVFDEDVDSAAVNEQAANFLGMDGPALA